jgi:hypothetical protein
MAENKSNVSETVLAECLEALAQGESVESILRRYPAEAAELAPLLRLTVALQRRKLAPSLQSQHESWQRMEREAAQLRRGNAPQRLPRWSWRRLVWGVGVMGTTAVVLLLLATSLIALSRTALPGDPLYGAKLTSEQWQAQFLSSSTELELYLQQQQQRREAEILALLALGEARDVTLTGELISISQEGQRWQVGNVPVTVPADAPPAQLGQIVRLVGRTDPVQGVLAATEITILSPPLPTPTPTPTLATTLPPTATPTVTPTVSSTPTLLMATVTPTTTATATATMVVSTPTAVEPTSSPPPPAPTPDDDDDDADDDSNNPNDDDSDDSPDDNDDSDNRDDRDDRDDNDSDN